ncbi:MAG: carboxylate-amine ligase [Acidobacteriota bacterium]
MPDFTIGIEEEFQIIDPNTRELKSHITEMIEEGKMLLGEQVKPEMHQSMVEVGTGICKNIQEARADLVKLRKAISELAGRKGLKIIAASTHPFSHWKDQQITPGEHYEMLISEMQFLAQSLLIFGMHVHIGIEDRESQIRIMNELRYFLPHLLAISTSSPFWLGMNTGLKSYRSEVFKKFPRTDIPDHFRSYSEYQGYVDLLLKTNCIDRPKKIWWDVRPHPNFPTLEIRICDLPAKVDEVIMLAALIQAIVAKLDKLHKMNQGYRIYHRALLQENKWRAVRWGIDGKLIDFGIQKEVPVKDLLIELLAFIDEVVDDLGSRKEVEYVHTVIKEGTSADRQLRIYEETKDFNAVVDNLIKETVEGIA